MWYPLQEFEERLSEEKDANIHNESSAFIFAAMGHGGAGDCLYLKDNKPVDLSTELVSAFDGANCPALRGKPKIFLFQACRSEEEKKEKQEMQEADVARDNMKKGGKEIKPGKVS